MSSKLTEEILNNKVGTETKVVSLISRGRDDDLYFRLPRSWVRAMKLAPRQRVVLVKGAKSITIDLDYDKYMRLLRDALAEWALAKD